MWGSTIACRESGSTENLSARGGSSDPMHGVVLMHLMLLLGVQGALQVAEAVRIDPEVYVASHMPDEVESPKAFVPPAPVFPLFMDLPLITGSEDPHAPYLAISADPWPGSVAVKKPMP